jgi:phosphoribosylcarboxyaminoimidazole (NCAIR) mutase
MKKNKPLKVSIIMGSQSDYKTMQLAETFKGLFFFMKNTKSLISKLA